MLEIGTHAGVGSALLAIAFPNARITTIDLPDNSEVFNTNSLVYQEMTNLISENYLLKSEISY